MSRQAEVHPELSILASFSGEGGVERMVLNLVNALAERGLRIDLLLIKTRSRHLDEIHPTVNRIDLGTRHTATSLIPLTRYLRRRRPPCLLAAKDRAGRMAVIARALAGASNTRLVLRLGTNLTAAFAHKSRWRLFLRQQPIRLLYPHIDRIIAVSEGVRQDTLAISGVDQEKVVVIRNPVITPRMIEAASAPAPYPWENESEDPLILAVGRLTLQKDFATLLRAFADLRKHRPCRLIILGDGRQRENLLTLSNELGISEALALPGFTSNPYRYMKQANLFVLSSRWEGSPNVLTEAMALGTPVVSTDCPSGPSELLDRGRIAPLVPVGDWKALSQAMQKVLDNPPVSSLLRESVEEYNAHQSASRYLEIMGLAKAC
ncbi:MAG: glycosyltransferase [Candidatus Thiodiazotropha endolucinida]|uniref:4-alpha-N-acetylgalactosaminyltransferase n=2 Tax=Candidatus Thiodiazotropha TaxID=1913444 RepID=A0A7Z1AGC0_9GAMM|nr:glycosyltransferase [Candidatus Thiodiazotropha endolucinida]MCG7875504.1 glycosyltransferase [Candidatus Thiodiazotropha taylori]MCG7863275.1 glycosyltransferase [Candidatus Thiodiazotropha endolucinida]MCG7881565.1 glycosyltransferase [Candidatus Thiodiazotropha taylori]MCG7884632.1 glycosyltransferase [Candidatus Thiodiazotropha taylori]MCG7891090.1 glycosyltransferase [Candidatus Thiodiazotropha taylori]